MAEPGERRWLRRRRSQEVDGPRPGELALLSYYGLGLTTLLLLVIGLVMVFSVLSVGLATGEDDNVREMYHYAGFPVLGLLLALGVSRLRLSVLRRLWLLVFPLALLGQALTLTGLGQEVNGNRSWLRLPGLGLVQPGEFLKVGLVLLLGGLVVRLHDRLNEPRVLLGWIGLPVALSLGLVLAGADLGTVIVMALIVAGALWVADLSWKPLLAGASLAFVGFVVGSMSTYSRRSRILDWLRIGIEDYQGVGYQPRNALSAIATGGWTGVGLGSSRQKWGYLTQSESDYIFAILCEELGLLGGLLVLVLFLAFGYFCMRIMRRSQDLFTTVTVGGIVCWVVGQALINMAVVVRVLPVLGVPLPLISRGGSSLIAVLLAVGVLLGLARHEPGAQEALAVRSQAVRRTLAVITPRRRNHDRS